MKRIFSLLVACVMCFALVGCEKENDGKINMPSSSQDMEGENYQEVVQEIQSAGFTNVKTEILDDLVLGWLTKDGEVEEVSVDNITTFSTSSRYEPDTEIVVIYHTFPEEEEEENSESATTEPTEDIQSNNEIQPTKEVQPTEETGPTEEVQASEELIDEIITVDNNEEFASVLNVKNPGDQIVEEFAVKYAGRTIEFDGNIAYMNNHGNYKTRYDFLIIPGDYSETVDIGPNFQFEDCNYYDLNLTGENVPDTIGMGDNLHIVAEIIDYNEMSELFHIKPISTTIR